ncbi:MAG TPA: protein kinase [Gemmatimonadaceae bacterium]|nr:protein kinase [Gemmatimonadaceae bacterium]
MSHAGLPHSIIAARYAIERELGHGGMATVYLARDERHQRTVAVKVLRPELAATLGAERFLREIRIAANLQHPHIITLIDSGADGETLYYVMPFVEGTSLRDRIAAGALPVSEVVRILRDVLDALAYAHAQGIVHRDVKPDNIMLSSRHALVVDFGVAKAMSAASRSRLDVGSTGESLTQLGTSVGTPAYMSPEQAAGDPDVNHSADLYAAGVVAYEMLAGRPPFTGTPREVLAAHVRRTPEPIAAAAPRTPPALGRLVMRLLEKDPARRHQSADAALAELEALATPDGVAAAGRGSAFRGRMLAVAGVGTAAVLAAAAYLGYAKLRDVQWARGVAIPEIGRLADLTHFDSAFAVATRAEEILGPDDSTLASLWPRITLPVAFTSRPAGARVLRTAYSDSAGWTELGVTPTDTLRVQRGIARYRFELAGHHPVQVAGVPGVVQGMHVVLQRADSSDGRMVYVTGGRTEVAMPGLSGLPALVLPDYYMDRHEVTNAEYRRFVRGGGYATDSLWEVPVVRGGRTLTRDEVQRLFVDRTGQPGPAGWEGGDFPRGQDSLPVGGVSWYEAAAYARFAGKALPTIYHWSRAATTNIGARVIPGSNYGGQGPWTGRTFGGMSGFGTFDMAGNVREWTWNATGPDRFILGGGWLDASYTFSDAYAQSPLDRSAINGIRLVRAATAAGLGPAETRAAIVREHRDYAVERPAADAVYRSFTSFYEYDHTPLNPKLDYRDTTPEHWIRERVSFDAAYGGERMAAVLFIPKQGKAPYQTVVAMGGSSNLYTQSDSAINTLLLDYLVKGGRLVVWPIFKGMYDRNIGLATDSPQGTSAYRDLMVMMVKDARRTMDYLATRPDVDTSRIAYSGYSFGGRVSPPILAMEPRFKAAVLVVTGLKMERARAEVDPINFLPRVRLPLIMLNGRHDYYFPVESSQKPFFEYLGTPPEHKRWIVYPEAHTVPRTESMRETMAWLDRYLGPVPR